MEDIYMHNLTVAHRLKDSAGHGLRAEHEAELQRHGFYLNTCLRQLAVMHAGSAAERLHCSDPALQWYRGTAAYSFLLQTATGLNSSIPGETNVLGQFRQAWLNWRGQVDTSQPDGLHDVMFRLFDDCAAIRRDYLQGIGGNSYGSLVRKLLNPARESRVLFVGAGKLARSMLPLFGSFKVGVWNYRPLPKDAPDGWQVFAEDATGAAAAWATHVVLTTPADSSNDELWWKLVAGHAEHVVHLGRRRAEPGIWSQRPAHIRYADLDDVFDLRNQQSGVRSLQLMRARKACADIAASYLTAAHGDQPQSALA